MAVNDSPHLGNWLISVNFFHDLTLAKDLNQRQALDPVFLGDGLVLIRIEVDQEKPAAVILGQLGKQRKKAVTGPGPFGPEVDQDGALVRVLQH